MVQKLKQIIKFGLVGSFGILIDLGFTYLCKDILGFNQYIANSIGFCLAASSNYFLNRLWTFRSTHPDVAGQYTKFFVISLVGLGLNNLIVYVLTSYSGLLDFYPAKLAAIGVVFFWNYSANAVFTFKH